MALSYVWGGSHTLTLSSTNIEQLTKDESMVDVTLPKTIADALFLAGSLGVDYLWVDALCILQDDLADKVIQIEQMHAIYQMSFVTIIAAAGINANAGLPGLQSGTRFVEQEEVVIQEPTDGDPGISLMTTLFAQRDAGDHYLAHTTWNSRGWTMQERVLSRRVLVFTEEQVYFACNKGTFCEESYLEFPHFDYGRFHTTAEELDLATTSRKLYGATNPVDVYRKHYKSLVRGFTQRKFTYDGDVFDGFSAIVTGLSEISQETFLWGLPRSRFELALSWDTTKGQHRRTSLSTLPMTSLNVFVPFPSWSWMGWVGEAWVWVQDERYELGYHPEIVCHIHQLSPLSVVRVVATAPRVSWSHLVDPGPDVMELRDQWKTHPSLDVSLDDIKAHLPEVYDKLSDLPEETTLFFWANVAVFTLQFVSDRRLWARVLDDSGESVGEVGAMTGEHWERRTYGQGEHEFIVIGSRYIEGFKSYVVVLQIERKDGFVYRVNVGEIDEEAWVKAERRWELIAMR
jgi:hypothetical protein